MTVSIRLKVLGGYNVLWMVELKCKIVSLSYILEPAEDSIILGNHTKSFNPPIVFVSY